MLRKSTSVRFFNFEKNNSSNPFNVDVDNLEAKIEWYCQHVFHLSNRDVARNNIVCSVMKISGSKPRNCTCLPNPSLSFSTNYEFIQHYYVSVYRVVQNYIMHAA